VTRETPVTSARDCLICTDELQLQDDAWTWPCRHHHFCVDCIVRWCEEADVWTCPLCRSEIIALVFPDSDAVHISFNSMRMSVDGIMIFAPDLLALIDSVNRELQQRSDLDTPSDREYGVGTDGEVEGDHV
jgi:hypothetical protein